MKYILCELDDEDYAYPTFAVYDLHKAAFDEAIKDCLNVVNGEDFRMEVTHNRNRISVNFGCDKFFVTEIKELNETKGDYALVWHHAYNGVGFHVEFIGSYKECEAKRKEEIKKSFDERDLSGGDNSDFDIETDNIVDTGEEWEVFSIVRI